MWTRSTIDPFISASERRSGLEQERMPEDPGARRAYMRSRDSIIARASMAPLPSLATEDHPIEVQGHPDVRARVFWPDDRRPGPVEHGGLPILVYFFGGSFTMGDLDWEGWDAVYRARAADAGVIVVAGEYSLAPEVRYPAQPEQCWSVLEWAAEHAHDLGGDPSRLAIGGASSGGNLAAATALLNRDRHRRPVRMLMLEVPVLDLTLGHVDAKAISPFTPRFLVRRYGEPIVRDYLGPLRATRREPYASPLLAADHSGLPPTVIYTAEKDPLRGDGEAFARALAASGVPVTCARYVGQTHGSAGYRRSVPTADHVHRDIVATLRTLHEPEVSYSGQGTEVLS